MKRLALTIVVAVVGLTVMMLSGCQRTPAQKMTAVGTPRNQTLIVYPFSGRTTNPKEQNPLMGYNVWFGMKDLGMGWLWETNTMTGKQYPELASAMPEVLNPQHTRFLIKLRKNVYWSDGVKFTADDVIFTLKTILGKNNNKLTWFGNAAVAGLVKSYKKVSDYSLEITTKYPVYDIATQLGVYTWASNFSIVPKHIFDKHKEIWKFSDTYPVVLGPYTLDKFDPNGYWALWKRRADWKRSAIGYTGKEPGPKYVLYKVFGTEQDMALALIKNKLDGVGFMSPKLLQSVEAKNPKIIDYSSVFPYHNFQEPCQHGVLMNMLKKPYNNVNVRWGLALSIDAREVAMGTASGETKINPMPIAMTPALETLWGPMVPWIEAYKLKDGFQPFDKNWTKDELAYLKSKNVKGLPASLSEATKYLGIGYWKYDPKEAARLFEKAGLTRNSSGKWLLADGKPWTINFDIPGQFNALYQRQGLAIADSWKKAGLSVNVTQLPSTEYYQTVHYNNRFDVTAGPINCPFTPDVNRDFNQFQKSYILPLTSNAYEAGNAPRWSDNTVSRLAGELDSMSPSSKAYHDAVETMMRKMFTEMPFIKVQEVPTTMAMNSTYWTGWPQAGHAQTIPFLWWSSFKYLLLNLKPVERTAS